MKVVKASARATRTQPATNFTGTVLADEVLVGKAPSRMRATRAATRSFSTPPADCTSTPS